MCAECHVFSDMPKINMHLNSIGDANHKIQVALTCIHGERENYGFTYWRPLSPEAQCPMACTNYCFNANNEIHS